MISEPNEEKKKQLKKVQNLCKSVNLIKRAPLLYTEWDSDWREKCIKNIHITQRIMVRPRKQNYSKKKKIVVLENQKQFFKNSFLKKITFSCSLKTSSLNK